MTVGSPLSGIRVVELANLIAGPFAATLLADMGADVIKVETLGGDLGRGFGPYLEGESTFFLAHNRGKRSICLDPKHPAAHRRLVELVATADVVVSNLRRGAMERMGLSYEEVAARNPRTVYAVVSPFGADGPYADRAGIDIVFQGEAGMISITGHPGDPPQKTATPIGDYVAATNTALAVCAALVDRERTGRGRRVDVSLRDGLIAVQAGWNALHFASGDEPPRTGTASPYLAPNQVFPTADGHLTLAIVSDRHYRILCDELAQPDLAEEYPTNEDRMANREALAQRLAEIFRTDTTEAWVSRLDGAGLPVGRVLTLSEVFDDPQVRHNEMLVRYRHPVAGEIEGVGSPFRVGGTPARASAPPPMLGEHTITVLEELGASAEEIRLLVEAGAARIS